jgi:hypothetical protein
MTIGAAGEAGASRVLVILFVVLVNMARKGTWRNLVRAV